MNHQISAIHSCDASLVPSAQSNHLDACFRYRYVVFALLEKDASDLLFPQLITFMSEHHIVIFDLRNIHDNDVVSVDKDGAIANH